MNTEQQQFIEGLGQHMAGWGLPRTTGRIYGYLLLKGGPSSSDEIAVELEVAKSGVSVAVRQLLALGLARSMGQRGSRRLLYEAEYDIEAIIAARSAQMRDLVERLRQGACLASGVATSKRLTDMAAVVQDLMDATPELLQRARAARQASGILPMLPSKP